MDAKHLANLVAGAFMTEPVHPTNIGYVKLTDELFKDVLVDVTPEDVLEALKLEASNRGHNYEFRIVDDYNVDTNTVDHIIEWRNSNIKEGE